MGESCENSGAAAGTGANEDVMAMAIFLQSNDCHLITIRARLAGCPARLPARLFLAFRLALDARYRHVQDDREQRKEQRRTLDHNLHGEVTWYIVPYAAA